MSLNNPFASSAQQHSPTSPSTSSPSASSTSLTQSSSSAPLFTAGGSAQLTQSPSRRPPGAPVQHVQRAVKPVSDDKRKHDAALAEALRQRVKAAFDRWDADRDGAISVADMQAVLAEAQSPVTAAELLEQYVRPVDSNGNGRIEWSEFEAAYMHKLQRDRLQPPDDMLTEMEQDLHRKQHAARAGGGGGQDAWKVGDGGGGASADGGGSSMQH